MISNIFLRPISFNFGIHNYSSHTDALFTGLIGTLALISLYIGLF